MDGGTAKDMGIGGGIGGGIVARVGVGMGGGMTRCQGNGHTRARWRVLTTRVKMFVCFSFDWYRTSHLYQCCIKEVIERNFVRVGPIGIKGESRFADKNRS